MVPLAILRGSKRSSVYRLLWKCQRVDSTASLATKSVLLQAQLQTFEHHRIYRVAFSTDTKYGASETEIDPVARRIARTVYRQLLRWCQNTGNIPLNSLIPPINIVPPEIDPYRLELLAHGPSEMDDEIVRRVRRLLPSHAVVERTYLSLLARHTADLKKIIQLVFRLNSCSEATHDQLKLRQSEAFIALRSLNELSARLQAIEDDRESHRDRDGVHFRIGQVVRSRDERWRGVISEWSRTSDKVSSSTPHTKLSSLTTKDYSFKSANSDETIYCNLILDAGDATAMGSSSGWIRAAQTDLEAIDDDHLIRISSTHLDQKFVRFDAENRLFVPTEDHGYNYPEDQPDAIVTPTLSPDVQELCHGIVNGVQELASRMKRLILDEVSNPVDRNLDILGNALSRLDLVIAGDVLFTPDNLAIDAVTPLTLASCHLRELHSIQLEIVSINRKRHFSKEAKNRIRFNLGDVVRHTFFDVRGVVVGWDPKPVYYVRNWDGVQHIDNPEELPFYHVVPDENDCSKAFGGPRSQQYVCDANLEECASDRSESLRVGPHFGWKRKSPESFIPPESVTYSHGGEIDDDGLTEVCLHRIEEEFNRWHLDARLPQSEDETFQKLSMKNIGMLLRHVERRSDASSVQDTMKEMRKAHPRREIRCMLDSATTRLLSGDGEGALKIYRDVTNEDSRYAEGWNKLATCQYMLGKNEESMESTKKVLKLDPENIQALCGLGLIHFGEGDYKEASDAFRKSMSLDPWSPVSSKLSLTMDLLNQEIFREEIP